MDLDDFAKGAVASLLTEQVDAKTGFAAKVSAAVLVLALVVAIAADGFFRWLAIFLLVAAVATLLFIFITKRLATGIINRLAPPADLGNAREAFASALAEAELPTGPIGFLSLIWRLRKGVGPEVERLGAVVAKLRSQLD